MKRIKTISALALLCVMTFASCKKDEDSNACDDITKELEVYQDKVYSFINNPTTAACNDIKQYGLKLIKRLEGCPGYDKASFVEAYEIYKSMDCSGF